MPEKETKVNGKPTVVKQNRNKDGKRCKTIPQKKDITLDKANDPAWYSSDSALVASSAALSFYNPVGESVQNVMYVSASNNTNLAVHTPGILKIPYVPTIGVSEDGSSAINLASIKLYSYVRHANSGARNYERADQMLIYVAIMNLVAALAHATRIYGIAQVYNKFNRYYPKAIINSMFENQTAFDKLINRLPDYLFRLNVLINKCSALAIPVGMSVLDRWIWMNSKLWLDAENSKAMVMYYMPAGIYQFDGTNPAGSTLVFKRWFTGDTSPFDVLDRIEEALNALITDEDVGIICGDIIKAFGADKLVTMNSVPVDYVVTPEYSLEVLTQVQHIYTFGKVTPVEGTGDITITQQKGNIIANYAYEDPTNIESEVRFNKYFLTLPTANPTEGDVLVATRLMAVIARDPSDVGSAIFSCGTELVERMSIWMLNGGNISNVAFSTILNRSTVSMADYRNDIRLTSFLDKMDYHPPLFVLTTESVQASGSASINSNLDFYCDYDYYTTISEAEISKLHDTAVLNEFSIASISTTLGYK